ncbi:hypothetical protein KY320_02885, partial [Candidatus Woesearchaeota archaeon]|nr:hypothetical protein [Candidatus Woesearchaeota archaeon]
VMLFVAESWKYKLYSVLVKEFDKTRDFKKIMDTVMKDEDLRQHGKDATKIIQQLIKSGKTIEAPLSAEIELQVLNESKEFLEREYKCKVVVQKAADSKEVKAKQALPSKPAILAR